MSKLIRKDTAELPTDEPTISGVVAVLSLERTLGVPLDVRKAIEREAERDPSDPFLARRLAAHYRQGIWQPADSASK